MKHVLLVFLCLPALLQTQKSFGQDTTSSRSVVISPALFVPVSVAAQGGIQFKAGKRWGILLEAAYPLFQPKNTAYEKIKSWRAGLELKYYLSRRRLSRYISLQSTYLTRQLTDKEDGLYYTKTATFAYTNAVIKSPVLATALKFGLEIPAGKRTYIDLFAGAGFRMIFTEYESETALVTSIEPNEQNLLKFDNAWQYNYTLKRVHLTAGVRFGFAL